MEERNIAAEMNKEAVERIKAEEMKNTEKIFFEDDEEIRLRDGKVYKIPPASLKDARKLMQKLKTVNVDVIILNFLPSEDDEATKQREEDLFDILMMAFKNYPEINREYIEEYVDVEIARKIIEILIGLNGLKK
jgi:hypothetical protein